MTVPAANLAKKQGGPRRRFVPENEQHLRDERRRCGARNKTLNERGKRVMQWQSGMPRLSGWK